jgi:hypothetical protein
MCTDSKLFFLLNTVTHLNVNMKDVSVAWVVFYSWFLHRLLLCYIYFSSSSFYPSSALSLLCLNSWTWQTARFVECSWTSSGIFPVHVMRGSPGIASLIFNLWKGLDGGRVHLKCDGTRWRTGGEVKGKLVNGVSSQYPSHYLVTWCIQHYYYWCAQLGCQ